VRQRGVSTLGILPGDRLSIATRKAPPPSPTSHDDRDVLWDRAL
jgi:hypothetical protein